MVNCMVKSCKNRGKIPGITYHQIPKYYSKEWLIAINRKSDEIISHRNVVCSQHFKTEDFKGGKHVYLKQGAIPSINLGEICSNSKNEVITSNNDDTRFRESTLSTPEIVTYTLSSTTSSSLCPSSLKLMTNSNQLIYDYRREKEDDPLGGENLQKKNIIESSDSEKPSDNSEKSIKIQMEIIHETHSYDAFQKRQKVIESSDGESTEIQKKLIQEFHDYSITPARHGSLAIRHTVNSIKKKLKAAQQKHRRLERRIIRLKDMLEKLKQKK